MKNDGSGDSADSKQAEERKAEVDDDNKENHLEEGSPLHGKKRSTSSEGTPTSKKVRNKPKPQVIDDMKQYMENNTIDKLTTTTLRHWLKERSLHCTTREKKTDLIEKVCKHIRSCDNNS